MVKIIKKKMGILHITSRLLVCKPKDEGDKSSIPPDLQSCGDSDERLPKLFIFGISTYKLLKGLLRKAASISCLAKPKKAADPLLPASSIRNEPLVNDEESAVDCEGENHTSQTDRHAVMSVPGLTRSPAGSDQMMRSAAFLEDNVYVDVELATGMNSTEEEEEEEEEETKVEIERWIKQYSSRHRLLLVGEGDFSFSACLAVAFQQASNVIATSLDSHAFLWNNYGNALSNIEELRSRGSKVMHGIDATTMANHQLLGQLRFDRIIFNFPYVGLDIKNLSRQAQLRQHQTLVRLFLQNAREMISENGEIHITHKTNGFHGEWRLDLLARGCGLTLIEAIKFNHLDYPGYNTKWLWG